MIKIEIPTQQKLSAIWVGERMERAAVYVPPGKPVFIITDPSLYHHYSELMQWAKVIVIPEGEGHKTLETVSYIIAELIKAGADRHSYLLGFGGGIVTDITGFVASIFMRGVSFGFVSTTLLSQVDASVGGKNGVNFEGYKNMVGVFNQPDFVICDPLSFRTLPRPDYVAGFSEIIKAAMIKDAALFEYLESHVMEALSMDAEVMNHLVASSVKIKAGVVQQDEREQGERKKLNLGHTFAHSIEKNAHVVHGDAVSIGLVEAAEVAAGTGRMKPEEKERLIRLLEAFGLPTRHEIPRNELFQAMYMDKKKQGNWIELILPKGIGDCEVVRMEYEELKTHILRTRV